MPKGLRKLLVCVAAVGAGLAVAGPASSQNQAGTTLSIDPTSGPIGTEITATITNCIGANADGTARLDFRYVPGTPANTEMFVPTADGTATVTIEAVDKEGHADATAAEVSVKQCKDGGFAAAPFTVVRPATTTGETTTTLAAGGSGGGSEGGGGSGSGGGTTTTTPQAPAATPSPGRIALTG